LVFPVNGCDLAYWPPRRWRAGVGNTALLDSPDQKYKAVSQVAIRDDLGRLQMKAIILAGMIILGLTTAFVSVSFLSQTVMADNGN
jgi:hypothetical protein